MTERAGTDPATHPPTVRSAFRDTAHVLGLIRDAWKRSDDKLLELIRVSCPMSNSFVEIGRDQYRAEVSHLLGKKLDGDLLPFVLPHCDPSLRDRIQALRDKLDLNETEHQDDEPVSRWRLTWAALQRDRELDGVAAALRAKGEEILQRAAPPPPESPSLPDRPEALAAAIDKINRLANHAMATASNVRHGQNRRWDKTEPKSPAPMSKEAFVQSERDRIEEAGVQQWDSDLAQKALCAWEDHAEFCQELAHTRESYFRWKQGLAQGWGDLGRLVGEADAAVRESAAVLTEQASLSPDWINQTLALIGNLRAVHVRYSREPARVDPANLEEPAEELFPRLHTIQTVHLSGPPSQPASNSAKPKKTGKARKPGTPSKADKVRLLLSGERPYEGTKQDLAEQVGYTQQAALGKVKNFDHLWSENERRLAQDRADRERRMNRGT